MSKFEKLHKTTPRPLQRNQINAFPRTLIEGEIFFHLDYVTDLAIPCFKRTDFAKFQQHTYSVQMT